VSKVKKPKSLFKANSATHGLYLESNGSLTCECDILTTYARTPNELERLAKWLTKAAQYTRQKQQKKSPKLRSS
jgi:hypothetical protein